MIIETPRGLTYRRHGEDGTPLVHPGVPSGLYIVQSSREPTCYRVGAGGVATSTSTLFNRIKQHRSLPPNRPDIDWTEYHRPWKLIWVVQFPKCRQMAARLCEAALTAELASRYHFIAEATGSGFCASADQAHDIAALANSLDSRFEAILTSQSVPKTARSWQKGARGALPSRYIDSAPSA